MDTAEAEAMHRDFEERILDVVEEAMGYAYHEGACDALDAAEAVYADAESLQTEVEACPCGCGITFEEMIEDELDRGEDSDAAVSLAAYDVLCDRLEAIEEYIGLKYTG